MLYNIRYQLNLYRRYSYWKDAKCIYIHVPKAAGTSINRAIYGRTLGHYKAREISSKFPSLYENSFVFSFVRNPWSRLLSAYKFVKKGRTETMGVRNLKQYQVPEFESFERFLMEWLPKKKLNELDFIFQPQYLFLLNENRQPIVDFIGKIENFDDDIEFVEGRLGYSLDIEHHNSTKDGGCYKDEYKNKAMINMVRELYSEDIKIFGYEF
ncbi:conserved hypothetical protein [Vibrio chagasii]|nr:conserved hypothetical protein [Vibrio chagasii]CAH7484468.1 conserved hypothetical protein [Vibrio chagasii]